MRKPPFAHRMFLLVLALFLLINVTGCSRKVQDSHGHSAANQAVNDVMAKAQAGDANAQYETGLALLRVAKSPEDWEQAFHWIGAAANQGLVPAKTVYGDMLIYQAAFAAIKKDKFTEAESAAVDDKVFRWWRSAAEQGDYLAQYLLVEYVLHGYFLRQIGTPKESVRWLEKASAQHFLPATKLLGDLYDHVVFGAGELVPFDRNKAEALYLKASEPNGVGAERFDDLRQIDITALVIGAMLQGKAEGHRGKFTFDDIKAKLPISEENWPTYRYVIAKSQAMLASLYLEDHYYQSALTWAKLAAQAGVPGAMLQLAGMYAKGIGTTQDYEQSAMWYLRLADTGELLPLAALDLGKSYYLGRGVPRDLVMAHMWLNIAASQEPQLLQERTEAQLLRDKVAAQMSPDQLIQAQRLARAWKPRGEVGTTQLPSGKASELTLRTTGTGFFVNQNGLLLTAYHVVKSCREIRISHLAGTARLVADDQINDIALLQANRTSGAVAVFRSSNSLSSGEHVVVVGYPLSGLLGSQLNITTGVVSALSGPGDNWNLVQFTAPVQTGNSGSPLLDTSGRVIGLVIGKLDVSTTAQLTGDIPENVNFAVKLSYLKTMLEGRGVRYMARWSSWSTATTTIAERARDYTVPVECWR